MKLLYLDCKMGAAGDMLTAALLELLPDPDEFVERLNRLSIPGVVIKKEASVKGGILGTHVSVKVEGEEEESHDWIPEEAHVHEHGHTHAHEHEHEHTHEHTHHSAGHHHTGMHDISHIVENLELPQNVKKDILAVYGLIAEAESHVHGAPVSEIHFHEVGSMDAVADVTAVCMLMNELSPDRVIVSPVHVGSGQVRCAHGILPVPAPATAFLLQGIPIWSGPIKGELCTPTGAALLKYFATDFAQMPAMTVQSIGYGMGQKDFEAANCVRALLGESQDCAGVSSNEVTELSCNVDDMTGEEIGFAMERFFEEGALDVYTVPIGMKKSRPGILIRVMCRREDTEKMVHLIFQHTTTIGIRENVSHRYVMDRNVRSCQTHFGEVHLKESTGFGVTRCKYEYDDIARIAAEKGMSLREAKDMLERDASK